MQSKRNIVNNVIIVFLAVICGLVLCSIMLRFLPNAKNGARTTAEKLAATNEIFKQYTKEELDFSLPLYTNAQGQECVEVIRKPSGMHYSPYFGWNTQKIDLTCAKKHLSKPGIKVLYFGGSAMENFEAPNYLTKIDNYVNNHIPNIISLNFAESGGRSTNNLVRIMLEAIELPANYWVFVDGYNEFNSIKYGGNAEDDYYWTAVVHDRIHRPINAILDKLISKSPLMERLFFATGIKKNPRIRQTVISDQEIFTAADYYVKNVQKITQLCTMKGMQCLFFLQPYKRYEGTNSTTILDKGYARILERLNDKVIDLRPYFNNHDEFFIDEVHYNKYGSEMLALSIIKYLK